MITIETTLITNRQQVNNDYAPAPSTPTRSKINLNDKIDPTKHMNQYKSQR